MSYSIGATGATKDEVMTKLTAEMDQVVDVQKCHAKDRDAALAAAKAFVDMLADDPAQDISVTMYGSVMYAVDDASEAQDAAAMRFTGSGLGINAQLVAKVQHTEPT